MAGEPPDLRGLATVTRAASLPSALPATRPAEETRTRRIPPYNVLLHNDDDHSMEFVVEVLCKVLGCNATRAVGLMLQAHSTGCSVIWTGPKEGAELKAE